MKIPSPPLSMPAADWLRLLVLSVLWGGSFFFVQIAVPHLPPLTLVWLRVALAAAILALALRVLGIALPRGGRVWRALLVMGLLNNVIPFTCFVIAQSSIPSALAAILNATTPLFTLIVAALLTADERLTRAKGAGLAVGFAGVVVLVGGSPGGAAGSMLRCLAAALPYAISSVWGKRFRAMGAAPPATAFGMLAASTLMLLPVVLWHDRPWTLTTPPPDAVAALLGLAVLSTAVAYLLYFRILAGAGAVNLSLVTFLIPVSAMAFGVLLLGERLEPRHVAGMALIAAGLSILDGRLWRRKV
jgi:drug/metabolite transporter (DMT)-like permease